MPVTTESRFKVGDHALYENMVGGFVECTIDQVICKDGKYLYRTTNVYGYVATITESSLKPL